MKRQEKLMEKQQNDYLNELVQSSGKNFSEEANKITVIEERKKLASFLRQQIEGKEKEKSLTKEEKLNQSKALEEFNKLLKQEKQEEIEKKKLKMLKTRSDLDKCLQDKLQRKAEEQSLKSELDGLFASLIQQAGDEEDSGQKKYKVGGCMGLPMFLKQNPRK
ncbi:unnamed protein product [Trichobilharzia regenti]|nr:unnamed protein product [Trichobilharzia regenti]